MADGSRVGAGTLAVSYQNFIICLHCPALRLHLPGVLGERPLARYAACQAVGRASSWNGAAAGMVWGVASPALPPTSSSRPHTED